MRAGIRATLRMNTTLGPFTQRNVGPRQGQPKAQSPLTPPCGSKATQGHAKSVESGNTKQTALCSCLAVLETMMPPVPPWAVGNTPEPVSLDIDCFVDVTPYVRFETGHSDIDHGVLDIQVCFQHDGRHTSVCLLHCFALAENCPKCSAVVAGRTILTFLRRLPKCSCLTYLATYHPISRVLHMSFMRPVGTSCIIHRHGALPECVTGAELHHSVSMKPWNSTSPGLHTIFCNLLLASIRPSGCMMVSGLLLVLLRSTSRIAPLPQRSLSSLTTRPSPLAL